MWWQFFQCADKSASRTQCVEDSGATVIRGPCRPCSSLSTWSAVHRGSWGEGCLGPLVMSDSYYLETLLPLWEQAKESHFLVELGIDLVSETSKFLVHLPSSHSAKLRPCLKPAFCLLPTWICAAELGDTQRKFSYCGENS